MERAAPFESRRVVVPRACDDANQKTCYMEPLRSDVDVPMMLHPDGRHDPQLIIDRARPMLEGSANRLVLP